VARQFSAWRWTYLPSLRTLPGLSQTIIGTFESAKDYANIFAIDNITSSCDQHLGPERLQVYLRVWLPWEGGDLWQYEVMWLFPWPRREWMTFVATYVWVMSSPFPLDDRAFTTLSPCWFFGAALVGEEPRPSVGEIPLLPFLTARTLAWLVAGVVHVQP